MVCCCDAIICMLLFRIANGIAAVAGLGLLGCGLYLQFGGTSASSDLLEFLRLQEVEEIYKIVARYPIWICVVGAAIFVLAAVSICVVSTPCGKCYLCLYSPILMILSIAILFGTIVLYLASRTIKSSDFQEVTILGYELTDKMEGLWIKGVIDDTAAMCELQEVVQCSGFYDDQCVVPPTGNFTQAQVLAACPARSQIFKSTGQFGGTTDNATLSEISASAGYDVGACLESEVQNEAVGCLRSLSEILYQLGNVLFIPGLVLGGYFLVLSLISSYMTCCTLCGGKI